eukprot:gene3418-6781_t
MAQNEVEPKFVVGADIWGIRFNNNELEIQVVMEKSVAQNQNDYLENEETLQDLIIQKNIELSMLYERGLEQFIPDILQELHDYQDQYFDITGHLYSSRSSYTKSSIPSISIPSKSDGNNDNIEKEEEQTGVVLASIVENAFNLANNTTEAKQQDKKDNVTTTTTATSIDDTNSNFIFNKLKNITLTFLPDLFIVSIILLLAVSPPKDRNIMILYRFILIQFLMMGSILFSFLQNKETYWGLWRNLLQHPILTNIGYISYPMYLLQRVLVCYYGHILYDDIQQHRFPLVTGATNPEYEPNWNDIWLGDKPWWWKLIALLCLVAICWPIQRYFQDGLIANLAVKFLSWRRNKKKINLLI